MTHFGKWVEKIITETMDEASYVELKGRISQFPGMTLEELHMSDQRFI